MRANRLALCLLTVCLTAGCLSSQRKPFVNNPLLLYYKPTLSDSATILAEQAARREPAQPPMPGFAREIAPTSPLPLHRDTDAIKPAKAEVVVPDIQPVIRQSSAPSSIADVKIEARSSAPAIEIRPEVPAHAELVVKSEQVAPPTLPTGPILLTTSTQPTVAPSAPAQIVPAAPRSNVIRSVAGSYGHDADYRWLQGVVQRLANGGCFVRYCDPSVEDQHGGKVRVENEAELAAFHDGDVVGMQGELNPDGARAGQTPRYHIQSTWLVRQKN